VVLCNVLRSLGQCDRRIFGDISRRLFHWSSLMCGSVSDASYRIWIAYCRHSSTSGSPALPEPTTRSSCLATRRCWTTRANSLRSSSSRRNPRQRARSPKSVSNRCLALLLAFGAGHLKWQDSSARDSQMAGVQSVHATLETELVGLVLQPHLFVGDRRVVV
jgi:hypothetical protein